MTITIVSIFSDPVATRAAVDQLVRDGLPASRIKWHEHTPTAQNTGRVVADEMITGGFINNLVALFDGLLDHHVAEGNAETYADVVRSEGTLLSIQAENIEQVRHYVALLRKAGAQRVSELPEHDTVSFHRLYPELSDTHAHCG